MGVFIGFAGGLLLGLMFWWQAVVHESELTDEYLKLQRELMLTRRELLGMEQRYGQDWPEMYEARKTTPSRN